MTSEDEARSDGIKELRRDSLLECIPDEIYELIDKVRELRKDLDKVNLRLDENEDLGEYIDRIKEIRRDLNEINTKLDEIEELDEDN